MVFKFLTKTFMKNISKETDIEKKNQAGFTYPNLITASMYIKCERKKILLLDEYLFKQQY